MSSMEAILHHSALRLLKTKRQMSPRLFGGALLLGSIVFALAHYTFRDLIIYPRVRLWGEHAYWRGFLSVICTPMLFWCFWSLVSFGRLRPASLIFLAALVSILGDLA